MIAFVSVFSVVFLFLFFVFFFFFFNDTATTEIYTLSLHDALPILLHVVRRDIVIPIAVTIGHDALGQVRWLQDRKSTRLNSSHTVISYAVFCLKKKKTIPRVAHTSTPCEA